MFLNPSHKTMGDISSEWDRIAPVRIRQILSGKDISFDYILLPNINLLLEGCARGSLLDAGCGVGVVTDRFANQFKSAVGIDPSSRSIEIAKRHFGESVNYYNLSIEQYVNSYKNRFDVIIANMVLMDSLCLSSFIESVSRALKPGGVFIFSITHPFFWPEYCGYSKEPWFDYSKELIVESPFRITAQPDCRLISTHIHRPIAQYFSTFGENALAVEEVREPLPALGVSEMYPAKWKYPRYMVGRCRKPRSIGRRLI